MELSVKTILCDMGVPANAVYGTPQTAEEDFFALASFQAVDVGLRLRDKYGTGVFERLGELDLYGEVFWLFYRGECFGDEAADPIAKLYQLIESGEAAELAPQYIDEASS